MNQATSDINKNIYRNGKNETNVKILNITTILIDV